MGKHSFLSASASHKVDQLPAVGTALRGVCGQPQRIRPGGERTAMSCAPIRWKSPRPQGVKNPTENLTYYSQEMEECAGRVLCLRMMEEVAEAGNAAPTRWRLWSSGSTIPAMWGSKAASALELCHRLRRASPSSTTSTGLGSWCRQSKEQPSFLLRAGRPRPVSMGLYATEQVSLTIYQLTPGERQHIQP